MIMRLEEILRFLIRYEDNRKAWKWLKKADLLWQIVF
jgi:hypothetical protein